MLPAGSPAASPGRAARCGPRPDPEESAACFAAPRARASGSGSRSSRRAATGRCRRSSSRSSSRSPALLDGRLASGGCAIAWSSRPQHPRGGGRWKLTECGTRAHTTEEVAMTAQKQLISVAAFVVLLLGLARPAVAANWTTEPVPAGPGALGPARLSFDAQGRALLLFNGVPTASQPRFTGMATRAPGGGWTRLANLPGVGWGNAQALQYATTRVLFVSGQVASVGAFNRAKLRLVAAFGRSDGTGLGSWQTLAPSETGFVAAANHCGSGPSCCSTPAATVCRRSSAPPAAGSARRRGSRRPARSPRPSRSTRAATGSSRGSGPGASRHACAPRAAAGARCSRSRSPPAWRTPRCGRR